MGTGNGKVFEAPSEGLITYVLIRLLGWEPEAKPAPLEPISVLPALPVADHTGRTLEEILYMLRDGLAAAKAAPEGAL
ncbi:hypothetical protein D5S18_23670 [Nocardia panacis]|uniref:Uncharacterized protein n=2 Tax=Nocardia panacis TaxID=2340916 RepID=A0A3A4KAR8_9NOCA|nr:hypothetical protein D5S18_23670 [Nocardia panacis]